MIGSSFALVTAHQLTAQPERGKRLQTEAQLSAILRQDWEKRRRLIAAAEEGLKSEEARLFDLAARRRADSSAPEMCEGQPGARAEEEQSSAEETERLLRDRPPNSRACGWTINPSHPRR